jgi:energy-coupling factor transporter ATP-binding protein EcfA2
MKEGERLVVIGPSGGGKSTFAARDDGAGAGDRWRGGV